MDRAEAAGDAHAQADVRARLCRRLEGILAADPGAADELARLLTESAPSHTSIAPYVDLVRLTVNGGVNHGPVFQR